MAGPYINTFGRDKAPVAQYYDKLMPWVEAGGPASFGTQEPTLPPEIADSYSPEEAAMIRKLLLAAFGGENDPMFKRYDEYARESGNRAVHGPGMWNKLTDLETP
jgi:hypothetical protein